MNVETFEKLLADKEIELTDRQLGQFNRYFELLVEWNEKMNLTAITDREEVYNKHFFDSISPAFYFDFKDQSICDIGAGAGFPSIPLKICFPDLKVTIVDSLNKRIQFLNHLATELELTNVRFVHDRAETFGRIQENRENYDIVTARAVARLSVLSELCLPLVKKNGTFLALKGAGASDELEVAKMAISTLGGKLRQEYKFELPENGGERGILVIQKSRQTPGKYPRRPGVPNKEPLE